MIIETDSYGEIDIGDLSGAELAEAYAEEMGRNAELMRSSAGKRASWLATASTSPTPTTSSSSTARRREVVRGRLGDLAEPPAARNHE